MPSMTMASQASIIPSRTNRNRILASVPAKNTVMISKLTKKLEFSDIAEKTGQDSRNPRKGRPLDFGTHERIRYGAEGGHHGTVAGHRGVLCVL